MRAESDAARSVATHLLNFFHLESNRKEHNESWSHSNLFKELSILKGEEHSSIGLRNPNIILPLSQREC